MADALLVQYIAETSDSDPKIAIYQKEVVTKKYTYKNYISWGEDVKCELIDGIPYMMAAPGRIHQRLAGGIYAQVWSFLNGKVCEAYIAPFDVRLFPEDDESDTVVVQPDILVVCDKQKLSGNKACNGAPDFVAEVVSEGSRDRDFVVKRDLYEQAGVREYWVVDPVKKRLYKYVLTDGIYHEVVHDLTKELSLEIGILPDCVINFGGLVS